MKIKIVVFLILVFSGLFGLEPDKQITYIEERFKQLEACNIEEINKLQSIIKQQDKRIKYLESQKVLSSTERDLYKIEYDDLKDDFDRYLSVFWWITGVLSAVLTIFFTWFIGLRLPDKMKDEVNKHNEEIKKFTIKQIVNTKNDFQIKIDDLGDMYQKEVKTIWLQLASFYEHFDEFYYEMTDKYGSKKTELLIVISQLSSLVSYLTDIEISDYEKSNLMSLIKRIENLTDDLLTSRNIELEINKYEVAYYKNLLYHIKSSTIEGLDSFKELVTNNIKLWDQIDMKLRSVELDEHIKQKKKKKGIIQRLIGD